MIYISTMTHDLRDEIIDLLKYAVEEKNWIQVEEVLDLLLEDAGIEPTSSELDD